MRVAAARVRRRRPTPSARGRRCLAHLDQVRIGIADVGADLASVILRLGEELGTLSGPLCIGCMDIRDAHVEEGAGAVRIGRGRERDRPTTRSYTCWPAVD